MIKKIVFGIFISSSLSMAAVNEIIPGDYEAPNVGVKLVTLYLAKKTYDGPYVDSSKVTNEKVDSLVTALKLTNTIDIAGHTLCPMIALPYSKTNSDGDTMKALMGEKSVGTADIIVGGTGWLVNNKKANRYLAGTALIFVPTGRYDSNQVLNIGEHRYKATFNIGYVDKIGDKAYIELSPEIAIYGDNNNYVGKKLQQNPSFAFTTNLRYDITPKLTPFVTYQKNFGGETKLDGVKQNDSLTTNRVSIGGYYYMAGGTQIFLRFAKEQNVKSGMRVSNDALLRFQWWFM